MEGRHVLLVTFPAQGHINPSLQFAKKLMSMGIHVTFATSIYARRRMAATAAALADGLSLVTFSDGFDDGFKIGEDDAAKFMTEIRSHGSKALKSTILAAAARGRPVTTLIYTLLLPWAAAAARELHIPSALLWIQSATALTIYYYYFHGYSDEIAAVGDKISSEIQIPGAPPLSRGDLPSFMLPSSSEAHIFTLPLKEQLDGLDAELPKKPRVLVNTFDALEAAALGSIAAYDLIGVGPLIPDAFVDGGDPADRSFGGDLFEKSDDCGRWLDSQRPQSVVYLSFGSLLTLPKVQVDEIAGGLLRAGRPFLWVIREEKDENEVGFDKMGLLGLGKVVRWCPQLEVLTHPSLGCFVTHCGWNSTLESLTCGAPVVAFPHWTDQGTNAKMIEDVWGTGVRVRPNEDGIVERDEIWRCVEEVMDGGPKSLELRENANKWKVLAREAAAENGSSTRNWKAFF